MSISSAVDGHGQEAPGLLEGEGNPRTSRNKRAEPGAPAHLLRCPGGRSKQSGSVAIATMVAIGYSIIFNDFGGFKTPPKGIPMEALGCAAIL